MINYYRICALAATGSMEGTRMLGTVPMVIDYSTPWECARRATFQTITR